MTNPFEDDEEDEVPALESFDMTSLPPPPPPPPGK